MNQRLHGRAAEHETSALADSYMFTVLLPFSRNCCIEKGAQVCINSGGVYVYLMPVALEMRRYVNLSFRGSIFLCELSRRRKPMTDAQEMVLIVPVSRPCTVQFGDRFWPIIKHVLFWYQKLVSKSRSSLWC